MKANGKSQPILRFVGKDVAAHRYHFGVVSLGVVSGLANGALDLAAARALLFNANMCLLVHKRLGDKTADEIMSRGTQLEDLFEALPRKRAREECEKELATMTRLSRQLLRTKSRPRNRSRSGQHAIE